MLNTIIKVQQYLKIIEVKVLLIQRIKLQFLILLKVLVLIIVVFACASQKIYNRNLKIERL